ncbi:MAG: hypothetical protein V3V30_01260 [Parvularculaceae bacterium]
MFPRFISRFVCVVAALSVAGCAGNSKEFQKKARERNPAPCPNVLVLQEAADMVEFVGEPALENIAFSGEVTGVETSCRYFADTPIEAEIRVSFAFGKGPMANANVKNMKYFVAVTRTNKEFIAKEEFDLPVNFKRGDVVTISDTVGNIVIPRKDDSTSGTNFEIVVGLVLTKQQVIYNRSGKSLKFPDLQ